MSESQQNTTFASNGGQAHGYLAVPDSGSGPGVVVIQEWWGLTPHIVDIVDRLAAAGLVALAPDLFGGRTAHDKQEAGRLMQELPADQAARDLGGAVDLLLDSAAVTSSTVGVVGFCMGGGFVLSMASQQGSRVSAAVVFYGLPSDDVDYARLTAAVQGHFGRQDGGITPDAVDAELAKVAAASEAVVTRYDYDAGHAFLNDERPEAYDATAAATAWERTVAFLRDHVR